ncbi:MAG: hypothetical protein SFY56_05070 [Bacteroidota bacterium]|nr:hypothetical protein [Bacteroidota bacterium]
MKKLKFILIPAKSVLLIIVCFFIVSCNSCSSGKNKVGGNEEGIIEFDTKGVDDQHPLYGLAPSSATLKFKKEKFVVEMSTMGMFNTTIIGDTKAKTVAQTVKFMDIKQACIENEKEVENDNKDYELKIEETKETKKIAGLKCYKLNVTMAKDPSKKFTAWYTKDLGLEDCNLLNSYSSVKGVLMDYRVKKMGLEMHFVAKSYKNSEVPDNTFEVPASMKIVSKEEMAKFFANLQ